MEAWQKTPGARFRYGMASADQLWNGRGKKRAAPGRKREEKSHKLLTFALPAAALPVAIIIALMVARGSQTSPPPSEVIWSQAPDLLKLVDPGKDAVAGAWRTEKGSVVSAPGPRARLEIPWRAPP